MDIIQPGDVVVDAGANFGSYSIPFARKVRYIVVISIQTQDAANNKRDSLTRAPNQVASCKDHDTQYLCATKLYCWWVLKAVHTCKRLKPNVVSEMLLFCPRRRRNAWRSGGRANAPGISTQGRQMHSVGTPIAVLI